MLSALMKCSLATFASNIEFENDSVMVTREVDGGLQTIKLQKPTVITTDLRLNEPRYASLPNIMKAKRKIIDHFLPADLNVDMTPKLNIIKIVEPPKRQGGGKVKTIAELVEKLKNEAGVI